MNDAVAKTLADAANWAAASRNMSELIAIAVETQKSIPSLSNSGSESAGGKTEGEKRFFLTRDVNVMSAQVSEFARELELALGNRAEFRGIDQESKRYVFTLAYCEYINISVLGVLWFDDSVTEILIDDWDSISVEIGGRLYKTETSFRDINHAKDVARRLSRAFSDRELTTANPLVTAELPGARVTFAIDSVVKTGLSVSIRKFSKLIDMEGLRAVGALSDEMFEFLDLAVAARANVLVSGGTGTGKTTMINALSESIPTNERVITIEDAYELKLATDHWVALQTKEAASGDDTVRVTLADLLTNTLRMRPDRIIVGEIRESKGAAVMLQAANTGHDGTMTTIHANSAERAVNFRLSGLIRQASQNMPAEVAAAEVSSALDLVVHVSREKGRRFIKTIAYVDPDLLSGPDIKPMPLFEGQLLADGTVQFRKVADLPETTALAMKINDFDAETRKTGDTE